MALVRMICSVTELLTAQHRQGTTASVCYDAVMFRYDPVD